MGVKCVKTVAAEWSQESLQVTGSLGWGVLIKGKKVKVLKTASRILQNTSAHLLNFIYYDFLAAAWHRILVP